MVSAKALKGHSHKLASFHTTKLSITVSCKGDVLYSTTTRIWVPIFYYCVVRCGSKNVDVDQKDVFLKGDWTTCSKYVHHSRFIGQLMIDRPIWPLDERKNLCFDDE